MRYEPTPEGIAPFTKRSQSMTLNTAATEAGNDLTSIFVLHSGYDGWLECSQDFSIGGCKAAALLLAVFASPLLAADLTGHWLSAFQTSDGQTLETSLYLRSEGDTLSGYLSAPNQDDAAITDAKANGDDISFTIVRDYFGEERRTVLQAS